MEIIGCFQRDEFRFCSWISMIICINLQRKQWRSLSDFKWLRRMSISIFPFHCNRFDSMLTKYCFIIDIFAVFIWSAFSTWHAIDSIGDQQPDSIDFIFRETAEFIALIIPCNNCAMQCRILWFIFLLTFYGVDFQK